MEVCSQCGKPIEGNHSYLMNDGTRGLFPMSPYSKLFGFGIGYNINKIICHACWSRSDIISAKKLRKRRLGK